MGFSGGKFATANFEPCLSTLCNLLSIYLMYRFGKYQLIYDIIRRNQGAFIISQVTGVKSWSVVPPSDTYIFYTCKLTMFIEFNIKL